VFLQGGIIANMTVPALLKVGPSVPSVHLSIYPSLIAYTSI